MFKNYEFAYNGLVQQFKELQAHLKKIEKLPEELVEAKAEICDFELPQFKEENILDRLRDNRDIVDNRLHKFNTCVTHST